MDRTGIVLALRGALRIGHRAQAVSYKPHPPAATTLFDAPVRFTYRSRKYAGRMPQLCRRIAGPEEGYGPGYLPRENRSKDGNIGYEPAAKSDRKQGNNFRRRLIATPLQAGSALQPSIHATQPLRHLEPMSYVS
jgi:hypothetical protein